MNTKSAIATSPFDSMSHHLTSLRNYAMEIAISVKTPEHLLLNCHHFINERSQMINSMKPQTTTLKTLFGTKKGHRKSEKISDRHRNRHKKVDFRRIERKRRE
jgi:hypothetical protein